MGPRLPRFDMNDVSFHEAWLPASFPGSIVEDTVESGTAADGLPLETRRVMSVDDLHLGVFTVEWTPLPFWPRLPAEKRGELGGRLVLAKLQELCHLHAVSKTLRREVRPWPGAMIGWLAGITEAEGDPLMVLAEVRCGDGVMVTKHAVVVPEAKDLRDARAFVTTLRPSSRPQALETLAG